jgi:hypothetical protein
MPFYSLVRKATNNVVQIVDAAYKKVDVHPDFVWKDGPVEYNPSHGLDHEYDPETNTIKVTEYGPAPFANSRQKLYSGYAEQLDQLWHDMDEGIIPGKEASVWFNKIKEIKDSIPKT